MLISMPFLFSSFHHRRESTTYNLAPRLIMIPEAFRALLWLTSNRSHKLERGIGYPFVSGNPIHIVNSHFRHQLSTGVLHKKLDRILEP